GVDAARTGGTPRAGAVAGGGVDADDGGPVDTVRGPTAADLRRAPGVCRTVGVCTGARGRRRPGVGRAAGADGVPPPLSAGAAARGSRGSRQAPTAGRGRG